MAIDDPGTALVPQIPQLPAGSGQRSVRPPDKSEEALSPVIESIGAIDGYLEVIKDSVGGLEQFTIGDFEKILEKYFLTKKDVSDAIVEALSRQTSYVWDTSFLVKNQVKAAEVEQRTLKRPMPTSTASSGSRGGNKTTKTSSRRPGKRSNLLGGYRSALTTAHEFSQNPIKMVDKIAELPFKLIDKIRNDSKDKTTKSKSDRDANEVFDKNAFQQNVKEGMKEPSKDFFGDFKDKFEVVFDGFDKIFEKENNTSRNAQSRSPLGTATDPIFTADYESDLAEVHAFSEGRINNIASSKFSTGFGLGRGFEGRLPSVDSGGLFGKLTGKGATSSEENLDEKSKRTGIKADNALFDTFDKPEKSHFGMFLDDQISGGGGGVFGGRAKSLLESLMGPILVIAFLALVKLLPEIISFFRDKFLPFIKEKFIPFVRQVAEVLGPIVDGLLSLASGIFSRVLSDILAVMRGDVSFMDYVLRGGIFDSIATAVVEWLGSVFKIENFPNTAGGRFLTSMFAGGLPAAVLGAKLGALVPGLGPIGGAIIGFVGGTLVNSLIRNRQDTRRSRESIVQEYGTGVEGATEILADMDVVSYTELARYGINAATVNTALGLGNSSREFGSMVTGASLEQLRQRVRRLREERRTLDEDEADLEAYVDSINPSEEQDARVRTSVRDAVITSKGEVIQTHPDDNIYAFKGDVSINPSNPTREFSGFSNSTSVASGDSASQNITHNHYSSNYNMDGMTPFSDFCPVGV